MMIKLWDWDKNWTNTIVFEGHTHYVMQVRRPSELNLRIGTKIWINTEDWYEYSARVRNGTNIGINDYLRKSPPCASGLDDHRRGK
jgi:hypothetical protein